MKDVTLGSFYNKEQKEETFKTKTARQWIKDGDTVTARIKEKQNWKSTAPILTYKGIVITDKSGKKFRIIGCYNPAKEVILLEFYNADKKKKTGWKKKAQKWVKKGANVKVKAFHIEYKTIFVFGPIEEIQLENNIVKLSSGEKLHWGDIK